MDWLRIALDRLSGFLASLIPGSVLFILFLIHRPDLISQVWATPLLSDEIKIAILLFFTVLMGWSLTFGFSAILGSIGGGIGGFIGAGPPRPDPDVPPWQNKNWRALLRGYLGDVAPENIRPVYDEVFQLRLDAIQQRPAEERVLLAAELYQEKAAADSNDFEWRGWWNHFHQMSFIKKGPVARLIETVSGNFYVASLVIVIALPFTPQFRKWWLISVCVFWLIHLVVSVIVIFHDMLDPWSSYTRQIETLQRRVGERNLSDED